MSGFVSVGDGSDGRPGAWEVEGSCMMVDREVSDSSRELLQTEEPSVSRVFVRKRKRGVA